MYGKCAGNEKRTHQNFNEKINEETWVRAVVNICVVVNLKMEIPRPAEWLSGF